MNTLDGRPVRRLTSAHSAAPHTIPSATARGVLAAHGKANDGLSCRACAFTYTADMPLCPAVADALRQMSSGTASTPRRPLLSDCTTARLRAMAREHSGDLRCRRCGFGYSATVRSCPTARRVAAELESRGKAPVTQIHPDKGLCAGKGAGWTVAGYMPAPWKRAMSACGLCPLLAACEADLDSRLRAGEKVREQVMAGRLFSVTGTEIAADRIDAFALARGRRKRQAPAPTPVPATPPTRIGAPMQLALFDGVAS